MMDEIHMAKLIADLRGGVPETCDYCNKPFNNERQAVPDEADTWSCTECWKKWEAETNHD